MLRGRLGIDAARIPQRSRHGLVYVERARVTIDNGGLVLAFDEAGGEIELPYQRINAILLGRGRRSHMTRCVIARHMGRQSLSSARWNAPLHGASHLRA